MLGPTNPKGHKMLDRVPTLKGVSQAWATCDRLNQMDMITRILTPPLNQVGTPILIDFKTVFQSGSGSNSFQVMANPELERGQNADGKETEVMADTNNGSIFSLLDRRNLLTFRFIN
jgi:hypothetical protein